MSSRARLPLVLALTAGLALSGASAARAGMPAAVPPGEAPAVPAVGAAAGLGEALAASSPSQIALARHLHSRGVVFYGAFWCQHCFHQKALFGAQAGNQLPYVECARDEAGERLCRKAGIEAYPTWVMGQERQVGVLSLRQLAAWTGYRGPGDFPTSLVGR